MKRGTVVAELVVLFASAVIVVEFVIESIDTLVDLVISVVETNTDKLFLLVAGVVKPGNFSKVVVESVVVFGLPVLVV